MKHPVITQELIGARAYQIYLERGCQPNHDWDDWLQAEYELTQLPVRELVKLVEALPLPKSPSRNRCWKSCAWPWPTNAARQNHATANAPAPKTCPRRSLTHRTGRPPTNLWRIDGGSRPAITHRLRGGAFLGVVETPFLLALGKLAARDQVAFALRMSGWLGFPWFRVPPRESLANL